MTDRVHAAADKQQVNPFSGSSLVPMLALGIALTLLGMIAAVMIG
jgi:hypothetical protein